MSMTAILIYAPEPSALLTERAFHVAGLVGERYPVEPVAGEPALLERLVDLQHAVIVTELPPASLPGLLSQSRATLPGVAVIALVDTQQAIELSVFDTDCHWLNRDAEAFVWLSQLASAVRQSELLASAGQNTQLDEVTNLLNRRYFMQRLSGEISLARRHHSPLCCVILSLDCYRMCLDSYGYHFINALLRFLADRVGGMIRKEDLIARLSDDEIAILLPHSTEPGAKLFTTRLVDTLNQLVFNDGAYTEELSVSAGVVGYPLPDIPNADADAVIRYGRHALHQAKASPDEGDKVRLFSELKPGF